MGRRTRNCCCSSAKRRVVVVLSIVCRVQPDHSRCLWNMIIRMVKEMKAMKHSSLKESINGLVVVSIDLKC